MKQNLLSASRLGPLACLLAIHFWTTTASRAAVLAGPITNTANGHIYYLLSPTNWPSAEAEAVGLRGHLATINDAAENTWVFNTFASHGGVARSLWLGLNDAAQEGNWVWVGGEAATYRKWAPGEPNNGGGFFLNEDQAVMRGPALDYSDSWNDAPGEQIHTPVVEVATAAPPTNTEAYDVASGFSTNSNPNGVWSYGSSATLGGQMTLFPDRGKWSGLEYWRAPILLGVPGVYRNPANITVTNSTGTAVLGPRQLSFYPGPNGEFCLIRFTAPAKGIYQVSGAFTGVDPHGTTTDVHILVNGVVFNGSVNGYGAGSGPTFNLIVDLNAGAPLDFVVGRSANSQFSFDSTGLSVQIIPPLVGIAPTITSQPQSRTVNAGTNMTFLVTATGTAPLSYQWRRNGTNLAGATGTSLTLSNVQPANAGTYSVRVTNAFGAVTSSNAVLTVLLPPTNCVSAPTGLVSWWRAESNALDSRDGNHGTLAGNTTYGSGKIGSAFVFDGNRDGVMVGTGTNLQLQNFSIEGWIKRTSTAVASFNGNGNGEIFVVGTNPGGFGFRIQQSDNRLVLGKSGGFQVSSAAQVTDTNWHHVAVTKLGTRVVFYVDGVAHQAPPFDSGPFTFSAPAYIGAWLNPNGIVDNSFYGAIDELAVYNRELTAAEIQAVYAAGNAGKCGSAAGVAPAISVQPQSQTVPAGAYVTFFVTATGTSPLRYQWRRNGDNLPGATNSSLTLSNVQPANAGNYSVRVTNAFGAVTSSNAVLTVVTTSTNCVGTPTGLVSWWRAESNFVDSVDSNHGTSAGNTIFGAGRVGQGFVFDGNGDGVRIGNPTNLQLQNFTIESWIKRTSSSVVSFSLGGLWAEFLCYGGGGYAFGFLGNGRLFLSKVDIDQTQTTVAITDTNFHHVAVTKAGSVVVFYIDGVAYPVEPYNTTYTFTQPAAIGARGDNLTGSFYGRIDELAVYNRALSASEVHGIYHAGGSGKCSLPAGVPPTITSQPQSRTVNAGTNVTFSVTATGTAPLSYQWRRNETNLPGATGSSLTLSNVQPANAGIYSVRVTNAFGAVTSSNATLTILAPGTNCVAPASGLISWWRAEGNASDAADGNSGTLSAGMSFVPGKVGQAFRFEGTNANVRVPASTSLNVGLGGGFTIETWINPAQLTSQRPLVEWSDGSTYGVHLWLFAWPNFEDGRALYLNVVDTSSQNHGIYTAAGTITTNGYQHVAATYNKTNGVAALYINGTLMVQQTLGVVAPKTTGDLYFGFRPAGPSAGTRYIGAMDEVSIYNRAMGSNEIAAIYAAGGAGKCLPAGIAPTVTSQPQSRTVNAGTNVTFSVTAMGTAPLSYQWRRNETNLPGATGTSLTLSNVQPANAGIYSVRVTNAFGAVTSSNAVLTVLALPTNCVGAPTGLVSWWRAEGNANDSAGTNNGATPFEMGYAAGEVGQAFDFIGTPRRVTVPDSPAFRLTNSFAVEGWIYARQSNSGVIFIRGDNRAGLDPMMLNMLGSAGYVRFQIQNAENQSVFLQAPVQINQWQHIGATLDGANGSMRIYVNGVLRAQTNTTIRPLANLDTNQQPAIGIGNHGGTLHQFPFNGLIDEISLYSRALSQNEIQAIYHAGTSGKCINQGRIAKADRLASLVHEPGAHPKLRFGGIAGKTYIVQASTNLKDWEVVGVTVANSDGICEFQDRAATKYPSRYYRVVAP